jgi:alkanesulfonate monooxygenase SsuD/methylene tetrahydromethanopterin reductase-like flavin-dependent oxidoreductase (luciferase family)
VRLAGAFNHPRPATPGGPPIWIGGKGGTRLLRLVARDAAGWNRVWKWTPEAHAERVRVLRAYAEEEGRDPGTVRLSVGLFTVVGEDERDLAARYRSLQQWAPGGALDGVSLDDFASDTLSGTVERCLERLAAFAQGGVEEMIVCPGSVPFSVSDWGQVELIAERLIPAARDL